MPGTWNRLPWARQSRDGDAGRLSRLGEALLPKILSGWLFRGARFLSTCTFKWLCFYKKVRACASAGGTHPAAVHVGGVHSLQLSACEHPDTFGEGRHGGETQKLRTWVQVYMTNRIRTSGFLHAHFICTHKHPERSQSTSYFIHEADKNSEKL